MKRKFKASLKKPSVKSNNTSPKGKSIPTTDFPIRLNRYISNCGICSRRQADILIEQGEIMVNGQTITELGFKINSDDIVKYQGKIIESERKVYILLNKPKDCVTTLKDPFATKTVFDYLQGACNERIYPVGRLDKNTTGVLLFTNDGDLSKRLTHPSFEKKKIYQVFLDRSIDKIHFDKIANGIQLEDGFIKPDALSLIENTDYSQIGIEIHSGKNRIVRRIFEHFNYKVIKLDRVYFAGLTKKGLQRGNWRFLKPKEINMLKMGAFK